MADVLELLIAERDRLDQVIAVLQGPRRRGRPSGSGKKVAAKKVRKRPRMSAEARKRRSEGMKKWVGSPPEGGEEVFLVLVSWF